jgi:hypothetical protein
VYLSAARLGGSCSSGRHGSHGVRDARSPICASVMATPPGELLLP